MRSVHYELLRLMQMRMDYVRIIASLKFILKKPIYVPSVEKEQCHYLMEMASQFGLNALEVRNFMRVLCKISRETQRKMHATWFLEQKACVEFLLREMDHIPTLQRSALKRTLSALNDHAMFICDQLILLLRISIRFIDIQMISLLSSLTGNFPLRFIKKKFGYWHQLPKNALLYKLFLLMNRFVKKE